ncbi:hypothetical protein D3C87_255840 [compost metagenome]
MEVANQNLERFIVECQPELEVIKRSLSTFNIFNILRVEHKEIRHSNFLGWLFDPNESHQLGDVFLKDLFKLIRSTKAIQADVFVSLLLQDLSATQVYRESVHNIDILIVNEKLGFVICIENKIYSGFAPHQLKKYHDYVEDNYESLPNRIYLTLTTFENNSHRSLEKGKEYYNITYQQVIDNLKSKSEVIETAIPTVKESIKQYISMTEKSILNNSDEVKLAQKIYKKYRNEIEFIIRHKPDFSGSKTEIENLINNGGVGNFEIIHSESLPYIIKILPKNPQLKQLFKDERYGSWDGEYLFCLELFVQNSHIWLKWCFGDIRNDEHRDELQQNKTELVTAMRNFDCFKLRDLKVDMHPGSPTENFVGVCGVTLFHLDTYLNQNKDFIEYFSTKFKELDQKLIQPWINECLAKL